MRERAGQLVQLGRLDEARAAWDDLLARPDGSRLAASSRMMALLYEPDISAERISAEHRRLAPKPVAPHRVRRRRRDSLRVGYVTGEFGHRHPCAQFMAPVLARHRRMGIESIAYLSVPGSDPDAPPLAHATAVRSIHRFDDTTAARLIVDDDLDLLVDLAGHTRGHRLGLLALRPAPAQATFLGYPSSTGFAGFDALIADAVVCPPEHEPLYAERILRLPHAFLCWVPPEDMPAPEIAAGPRRVRFGSLNHLPKINRATRALWAEVLRAAPETELFVKCGPFAEKATREGFRDDFARLGVDPDRLVLEGPEPFAAAMCSYRAIDVALDPIPYNGGTTTCHSLSMGCPVVTLEGDWFHARMGASLLRAAERPEWIARSREDYVRIAASLAADPFSLRILREELARGLPATPLCDADGYAEALSDIYEAIAATVSPGVALGG